jgi:hypothetical protein
MTLLSTAVLVRLKLPYLLLQRQKNRVEVIAMCMDA